MQLGQDITTSRSATTDYGTIEIYSNDVTAIVDGDNTSNIKTVSVTATPKMLNISAPSGTYAIQIMNLKGQIVSSYTKNIEQSVSISIGNLSSGVYITRIKNNLTHQLFQSKLIK